MVPLNQTGWYILDYAFSIIISSWNIFINNFLFLSIVNAKKNDLANIKDKHNMTSFLGDNNNYKLL